MRWMNASADDDDPLLGVEIGAPDFEGVRAGLHLQRSDKPFRHAGRGDRLADFGRPLAGEILDQRADPPGIAEVLLNTYGHHHPGWLSDAGF